MVWLEKRVGLRIKRLVSRILCPPTRTISTKSLRKEHHWSIGVYVGDSPVSFQPPANIINPVLTYRDVSDVRAAFVADPFMINVDGTWFMFFEVINKQSKKGEIGLAVSNNGFQWTYWQVVLSEPFHLSYPYVFEWEGEYFMVPESYRAGAVRLYKAVEFPLRWALVDTLLKGPYYADSSLFRYGDRWWLFTETNAEIKSDTLRLYFADALMGPWREHPRSPIVEGNGHNARPAGRILVLGGTVIRYAQDCDPTYGTEVRAFEVTELTTTTYQERAAGSVPVLTAGGSGWNESGMHHIDPHQLDDGRWLACVDGWFGVEIRT